MMSIIIIVQLNKEEEESRQPTQKEKRDLETESGRNKEGRTIFKRYE
jgi:hypothetical protein